MPSSPSSKSNPALGGRKLVTLALQGAGSHGAFTWGVLDRLLEDGRFAIEGVSGTSSGAMNAAMLVQGSLEGGDEGARDRLARFWHRVADLNGMSPLQPSLMDRVMWHGNLDYSPGYQMLDLMSRMFSPYQLNPYGLNPLREVLAESVDVKALRRDDAMRLFVTAANVKSGRMRIFDNTEMSLDALCASACLPFMFKAVEIDGQEYWDGSYLGNPALSPLVDRCAATDLIVIQVTPVACLMGPRSSSEIFDRVNEIGSNASLTRDLAMLSILHGEHAAKLGRRRINLHLIAEEAGMQQFATSSKLNSDRRFVQHLFELGVDAASRWIEEHGDMVGTASSLSPEQLVL